MTQQPFSITVSLSFCSSGTAVKQFSFHPPHLPAVRPLCRVLLFKASVSNFFCPGVTVLSSPLWPDKCFLSGVLGACVTSSHFSCQPANILFVFFFLLLTPCKPSSKIHSLSGCHKAVYRLFIWPSRSAVKLLPCWAERQEGWICCR